MMRQITVLALSALLAATVWTPTASAGPAMARSSSPGVNGVMLAVPPFTSPAIAGWDSGRS